jgi:hypothetical protein
MKNIGSTKSMAAKDTLPNVSLMKAELILNARWKEGT